MQLLSALIAGSIFAVGLLLSGMINPAKVQNFLDIFGNWDPSLAFVMAGAIAVAMPGYYLLRRKSSPLFSRVFKWPTITKIDNQLIGGSALFGIGWGLGGFCPGPAIAALPLSFTGASGALWFVPSMLVGLAAAKYYKSL